MTWSELEIASNLTIAEVIQLPSCRCSASDPAAVAANRWLKCDGNPLRKAPHFRPSEILFTSCRTCPNLANRTSGRAARGLQEGPAPEAARKLGLLRHAGGQAQRAGERCRACPRGTATFSPGTLHTAKIARFSKLIWPPQPLSVNV